MSDPTKGKCGCDWSLWETCDECSPEDDKVEIRRLRSSLAAAEREVERAREERDAALTTVAGTEARALAAERARDEAVAALKGVADFLPSGNDAVDPPCWCGTDEYPDEHLPCCARARAVLEGGAK